MMREGRKTPKQGGMPLKRIALEEHWSGPAYDAAVTPPFDINTVRVPLSRVKDIEQIRLPLMNECGITMQVLNAFYPAYDGKRDAAALTATVRKVNDSLAETVRKHPDRLAAFAALPLWDPKAAADELTRAVLQLGLKGTLIMGRTNGEYYDQQKYWPLWERAEELGAPVYLHPAEPSPDYEGHPELKGPIWAGESKRQPTRCGSSAPACSTLSPGSPSSSVIWANRSPSSWDASTKDTSCRTSP